MKDKSTAYKKLNIKIINHVTTHIYLYILLFFSSWLYFTGLDFIALSSWDEGWYASIAREILTRNDWRTLHFNGVPFYDHPPMGFWIMAATYKVFGVSEFTTRLPSVLAGIGTALLMYKLGEGLFQKKIIGFVSALILTTCVWYVLRVRSGNLDSLFVFFYVATIYTAFLTKKSFAWFLLCMLAFGCLVMTKTLAGVSAGILILWFVFPYILRSKWNVLFILLGGAVFYFIVFPWYHYHLSTNTSFYQYHFIHIGARDKSFSPSMFTKLQWELPLFYLHMGVRKWYDPWILSVGIVTMTILFQCLQAVQSFGAKKTYPHWPLLHAGIGLLGWNMVVLLPFLTTDLTELWHLIPVYAPLALVVAYGSYIVVNYGIWLARKIPLSFIHLLVNNNYLMTLVYVTPFIFIAYLQIKTFYYEVFPTSRYVVDEVDILKKAKKYGRMVYIDRDFVPIAVFYSEQRIKEQSRYATDELTIQNYVDQTEAGVLVTKNSAVEQFTKKQSTIRVLDKNNSYSIIDRAK